MCQRINQENTPIGWNIFQNPMVLTRFYPVSPQKGGIKSHGKHNKPTKIPKVTK